MTARPRTPIIVTGDTGTGTLAAVRGLHAGGYEVWLAVCRADTAAARSRRIAGVLRVADPRHDIEQHTRDLAQAATRLRARAVLPGTEGSLRAVTGREQLFAQNVAVGTSSPQALDEATDKGRLSELARRAGLEAPRTFALDGDQPDLDRLPFPAIVKPRRTADDTGRGVRVTEVQRIASADELRRFLVATPDPAQWSLQPYIEGTLAAICGVAWRGELVCAVHQESPRIWPVKQGITAYGLTTPPNPEREAGVAALVGALGWSGIFGVQFLLSEGHAYVIDFNTRIYGSLALAIGSGLNLPAIWADLLLGKPVTAGTYRAGVGLRVEETDYRALAVTFLDGRHTEALREALPKPRTVHATFALSDPRPVLTTVEKLSRRLVRRRERRVTARSAFERIAVAVARRIEAPVAVILRTPPIRRALHRRAIRAWRANDAPLILCLGNINRSPFAAELARTTHGKQPISAGFYHVEGRATPAQTIDGAAMYGVDLAGHRSSMVDADGLARAGAIFVFDLMNVAAVASRRFSALARTHLLGSLSPADGPFIADPHGRPPEVLDQVLRQISHALAEADRL